jgi:hypothetical protein
VETTEEVAFKLNLNFRFTDLWQIIRLENPKTSTGINAKLTGLIMHKVLWELISQKRVGTRDLLSWDLLCNPMEVCEFQAERSVSPHQGFPSAILPGMSLNNTWQLSVSVRIIQFGSSQSTLKCHALII